MMKKQIVTTMINSIKETRNEIIILSCLNIINELIIKNNNITQELHQNNCVKLLTILLKTKNNNNLIVIAVLRIIKSIIQDEKEKNNLQNDDIVYQLRVLTNSKNKEIKELSEEIVSLI